MLPSGVLPSGTRGSGPLGWAKHAFALARQRAVWQDVEGRDQAAARVVDGPGAADSSGKDGRRLDPERMLCRAHGVVALAARLSGLVTIFLASPPF